EILRLGSLVLGGSVSAACRRALLSGAALVGPPAEAALDDAALGTIARAAELIIPTTDTPGAIAAGVPDFIHRIVAEWLTADERADFLAGLAALEDASAERFGTPFVAARTEAQNALLAELEAGSVGPTGARFFARLKELTVLGYY